MSKNLSLSGKIIFEDNLLSGSVYFEETINEIKIENNKIITRETNIVLFSIFEFNNKRKVYKQYVI